MTFPTPLSTHTKCDKRHCKRSDDTETVWAAYGKEKYNRLSSRESSREKLQLLSSRVINSSHASAWLKINFSSVFLQ